MLGGKGQKHGSSLVSMEEIWVAEESANGFGGRLAGEGVRTEWGGYGENNTQHTV